MRDHVCVVKMCLIFSLDQSLKVQPAVDQTVLHAEVVPGGQHLTARGAGETVQMVNQVPGSHHHLRRRNAEVAPRTPLHRKSSADNTETPSAYGRDIITPPCLINYNDSGVVSNPFIRQKNGFGSVKLSSLLLNILIKYHYFFIQKKPFY